MDFRLRLIKLSSLVLRFAVVAVSRDYLTLDSALILPVDLLGTEYIAASVWPYGTKSQIAVTTLNDTQIYIQLPDSGELRL